MRKLILILPLILASMAAAQTVSPIVVECGKKCRGSFTVSNANIKPAAVTVEPASFSLSPQTGASIFRPLDSTAQVSLSETSARVGPQSDHEFDYEITCSAYPCLVAFQTGMVIGHTVEGIAIRLVIPHIVYVCEKSKDCRANARKAAGLPL